MEEKIVGILKDISDLLFPKKGLDPYEQALYFFVLRKSKLDGIDDLTLTLSEIASALNVSETKARDLIRGIDKKDVIKSEQTRRGYRVKLFLPHELGLLREEIVTPSLDIETIDFFNDKKYSKFILGREGRRCFYCSKEVTETDVELDHVVPQSKGGDNTYRNIVASCHSCNTRKIGSNVDDFLRLLYRKGLLTLEEHEVKMSLLSDLLEGKLKPKLA